MNDHHRARGPRPLVIALLSVLLVVAAFVMPGEWLEELGAWFGVAVEEPTAFTEEARVLDEALEQEAQVEVTPEKFRELVPHVGVRRALRAGPMTSDEVRRATRLFRAAFADDGVSLGETGKIHAQLMRECARLDPAQLKQELADFRRQLQRRREGRAAPSPGGGRAESSCSSCHAETRLLPDRRTFDVAGLYPHTWLHPAFEGGRRIPVMSEAIELSWRKEDLTCLSCHVPHGEADFEITTADRVANMDMWVSPSRTERDTVLHVRVKLRNNNSGHRAPGGHARAAYVVTADGFVGERPLAVRYGRRLPSHLRGEGREAGQVFARHMVDGAGKVTTDPTEAVDLTSDTRLQSGRFVEEDFVFDLVGDDPARVLVTLWYLPDHASWAGAQPIRRVDKTVP